MTKARHDISSSSDETSAGSTFTSVLSRRANTSRSGFTLVELLTVMVIIAILLSIIIGIAYYAQRAALDSKCRAQIEQMHNALAEYHVKYYTYPAKSGAYNWKSAVGDNAQAAISFEDPWGNPYDYEKVSAQQYTLFSWGADGVAATADDIWTGN